MILRKFKNFAASFIVFLLVFSLFCVSASAEEITMDTAQEVALRELEVLKSMGILTEKVKISEEAREVFEIEETVGNEYQFGRIFPHRFEVQWWFDWDSTENDYGGILFVDADTGKLSHFAINLLPGKDVEPSEEKEIDGQTFYIYDNFEDIFPADMTVDKFCSLLAEYWDFSGYTLSDTDDEMYGYFKAVSGESLLKDMPTDNYYLTVYFEGDQENVPMYIQIAKFCGSGISLFAGTNHLVG